MMMKHRAYTSVFRAHLSALALSFVALTTWAQQPQLTWLGLTSSSDRFTVAYDISADGKVVVGYANRGGTYGSDSYGFIWTRERGFQMISTNRTDRPMSLIYCISADGLTVGGAFWKFDGWPISAQWTLHSGPQVVPYFGGNDSYIFDTSADGSVLVGASTGINHGWRALRWTRQSPGQSQNLGTLGGNESWAYGVSADGSIVVGRSRDSSGKYRAFRWTQQTGMRNLGSDVRIGNFTRSYDQSEAFGISPDGEVIVGIAYNDRNEAVGFYNIFDQQLGERVNIRLGATPEGFTGVYPRRTNQDGSIIVGSMRKSDGTSRAMRWTEAGGLEDLNVTYASLLGQGEYLGIAYDITPDGRYIVGQGFKDGKWQGFILDTGVCDLPADVDGNGIVNDQDLLQVLFEFGNRCGQ